MALPRWAGLSHVASAADRFSALRGARK